VKRLIAAVVLLVLVVSSYFSGFFYVKNVCSQANTLLGECVSSYENNGNIQDKAKELERYWADREKTLSVFSNHDAIDEIEMSIHLLTIHSSSEDKTMFLEYSGKIEKLFHQLMEDTIPSAHSIL
jgi:hypothetical protein